MGSGWTSPTASWAAGASSSATAAPLVSASLARTVAHACQPASSSSSACVQTASKVCEPTPDPGSGAGGGGGARQGNRGEGAERRGSCLGPHLLTAPWPAGDLCEHRENPCWLREPCLHGGTCEGTRCLCPPDFSGPRCQQGNCPGFSPPPTCGPGGDTRGPRCLCLLTAPASLHRPWTRHSRVRVASGRQRGQRYVLPVAREACLLPGFPCQPLSQGAHTLVSGL